MLENTFEIRLLKQILLHSHLGSKPPIILCICASRPPHTPQGIGDFFPSRIDQVANISEIVLKQWCTVRPRGNCDQLIHLNVDTQRAVEIYI